MGIFNIEVKYEWVKTYEITCEDEDDAVDHAIRQAKEDLQDEMEAAPPSASELEVYVY